MYVYVWVCARVSTGTHRVQNGVSEPLELELQVVVSHPVLGMELKSSG